MQQEFLPGLREKILDSRDVRQRALERHLGYGKTVVFITVAIPGATKEIQGSRELFRWGLSQAFQAIPADDHGPEGRDILGPYVIYRSGLPAVAAKMAAVAIEEVEPAARLLDIDIYGPDGV